MRGFLSVWDKKFNSLYAQKPYFQGKKELFKGLAMEQLEKEWTVYPVLHIDFSLTKYTELTDLTGQLNLFLHRWEKIYGKDEVETTSAERLQGIILRAYKQTGKTIAVLIDEYDAPLLDSNSDIPASRTLRKRKFFRRLKVVWDNICASFLLRESANSVR